MSIRTVFFAAVALLALGTSSGALAGKVGPDGRPWTCCGPTPVPEPASIAVLGSGLAGLLVARWRRRR